MLLSLRNLFDDPWCIIGDFNDHLSLADKRNGPDRAPWLIRGFQDVVSDCDLCNFPLIGYQFTRFKSIITSSSKEARLDRAICMIPSLDVFPQATLQTLVAPKGDHP